MTPERWNRIEQIYFEARTRATSERVTFLQEACADDEQLRLEVTSLLDNEPRAERFIETTALEVAARAMARNPSQWLTGRTLGHYRIESLIGAGGMGEVYHATDLRLN